MAGLSATPGCTCRHTHCQPLSVASFRLTANLRAPPDELPGRPSPRTTRSPTAADDGVKTGGENARAPTR